MKFSRPPANKIALVSLINFLADFWVFLADFWGFLVGTLVGFLVGPGRFLVLPVGR